MVWKCKTGSSRFRSFFFFKSRFVEQLSPLNGFTLQVWSSVMRIQNYPTVWFVFTTAVAFSRGLDRITAALFSAMEKSHGMILTSGLTFIVPPGQEKIVVSLDFTFAAVFTQTGLWSVQSAEASPASLINFWGAGMSSVQCRHFTQMSGWGGQAFMFSGFESDADGWCDSDTTMSPEQLMQPH